jgi:hypothetical protein
VGVGPPVEDPEQVDGLAGGGPDGRQDVEAGLDHEGDLAGHPAVGLSGVPASVPDTAGTPARNEAIRASAAGRVRSLIHPGTLGPAEDPVQAQKVGV